MTRRDPQTARMVAVSGLLHATLLCFVLVVLPLVKPMPLPLVAYTVELTDSSSLGGRLAPGRADLPMGPRPGQSAPAEAPATQGEATPPPPPPPKPVEPVKPVASHPTEPAVKLPSIEKPPPAKPEAKKPEPVKAVEPAKAESPKPADVTKPAEVAKPAAAKPSETPTPVIPKPTGKPTGKPEGATDGSDPYSAAAEKWRTKGATGGGGGLGGTDTGSGPMGTPGYGGGGGGQVVGFEFLAYQQRVVTAVKGVWTNAVPRPGLVAKVRFQIAANGAVSGVRLEQPSGDGVFDGSAMRAVERSNPLPAPPARYVNEFREFMIEFHSEEGGPAPG